MTTKRPKITPKRNKIDHIHRKTPLLKPRIRVVKLPFKVVEVEKLPGCDSTVGGINKYAAEDPKYAIPYPYQAHVLLIDSGLRAESREKTIKHEKAEATIMATLRNLRRHHIDNIDYDTAHLLTNRLDFIYGNTLSYKKKERHQSRSPRSANVTTKGRKRREAYRAKRITSMNLSGSM